MSTAELWGRGGVVVPSLRRDLDWQFYILGSRSVETVRVCVKSQKRVMGPCGALFFIVDATMSSLDCPINLPTRSAIARWEWFMVAWGLLLTPSGSSLQ